MPNKTIYVSEKDSSLFDQAKEIAGGALSSVIVRALKEFISRSQNKNKGMKEISIKVGRAGAENEQRFLASWICDWKGFSNDRQWYLKGTIYLTQKENWAVFLETISKASLFLDKNAWTKNGDYLVNPRKSELIVGKNPEELKNKLPEDLYELFLEQINHNENTVEYLDI